MIRQIRLTFLTTLVVMAVRPAFAEYQFLYRIHGASAAKLVSDGLQLYGTEYYGYDSGGHVFAWNLASSSYRDLKTFWQHFERRPIAGLTLDGRTLYGTTREGNLYGAIYKLDTTGEDYKALHSFDYEAGGRYPTSGNLVLANGRLFGTTEKGGAYDAGVIYSLNTDGTDFRVLHSFGSQTADGLVPGTGLTLVGSTLYGSTRGGGPAGWGTLFKIGTDGADYRMFHGFSRGDATGGPASQVLAVGSRLYGTMLGAEDGGLYSIDTDGNDFRVLHEFNYGDGSAPYGGLSLVGSTLYGTTRWGGRGYGGTLYEINLDGTDFTVLHHFGRDANLFPDPTDGTSPSATMTLVGSTLYGTTTDGIFAYTVPEPSTIVLSAISILALICLAPFRQRGIGCQS